MGGKMMEREDHIRKIMMYAATHVCFKAKKPPGCECPPCLARSIVFGENYSVPQQERMKAKLTEQSKQLRQRDAK